MTELSALSATVGELLKEKGHTIAVSESSCGGLLSASLVSVSGASAYYVGGAIIYTRVGQAGLLRVPDEAMEGQRASTEYYAALNARTLREILGTTWALSETGASGPLATDMATTRAMPVSPSRVQSSAPSPSRRETTTAKPTCGHSQGPLSTFWSSASARQTDSSVTQRRSRGGSRWQPRASHAVIQRHRSDIRHHRNREYRRVASRHIY